MFDIEKNLKTLPTSPGVYLMFDESDTIIYVGKAKNLRNRVRQYFTPSGQTLEKVHEMVKHIARFEYIIVDNEVESLILESNFIKDKKPKYNILLKSGEKYPFIKITKEKFPRILKDRVIRQDGGDYYGPFPNAYGVTEIIELFQDMYKIRRCNLNFDKGQYLKRPCLYYFIHKCSGPCIKAISEEEYLEDLSHVEDFLKGKHKKLITHLKKKMVSAGESLNFELAARYRDNIRNLETIIEKQIVRTSKGTDMDIVAMARTEDIISMQVFIMRSGKIIDREHFILDNSIGDSDEEVFSSFLQQFYFDMAFVPGEIVLQKEPDNIDALGEYLSQIKGKKVKLTIPQRGEKVRLIELVEKNAKETLEKHLAYLRRRERERPQGLVDLENLLKISPINRIESYDISNTSGVQSVGSMVVYENGQKAPGEYRKFKIKTVEGPDDYKSHQEVLTRRLSRLAHENSQGNNEVGFGKRPSLIIIDGGKGQVNAAKFALRVVDMDIPICGLYKDEFHNTKGIVYNGVEIPLKISSPIYRFLYDIQEETHRFAINYHRKLREKEMIKSELDDIKGIGNVRKKALLTHFKSIDKIKEASITQLLEVDKMNRRTAEAVYNYFNGVKDEGN
ncbi:excinuclease ABC subunit UvrC [Lagierella sp.]|uniref:excinuclease ABC subunit UvrC n=1 Tax=Lagierella sp. TaxID=2849657 RepID=UPI00261B04E4|nr:excinuclease ABC subunit UvrC [Lagierella sp.]